MLDHDGAPAAIEHLHAVVFDFDGTICDTERSSFETARAVYREVGLDVTEARWRQRIGTHGRHWLDELEDLAGPWTPQRRAELAALRLDAHHATVGREPARPGVVALLDALAEAGVPLAVASSSQPEWVEWNLERLGLRARFAFVAGRTDRLQAKPAPDLYLACLEALGVDATRSVAVEDSTNGVLGARAAQLAVLAVPNPMTAPMDFSAASAWRASLEGVGVADLAALLTGAPAPGADPSR